MNIIGNLIFHCNNCDANRAFVTIRESTAAAPSSSLLNTKFTFKGRPPTIIFARLVRFYAVQLCRLTVFTQRNFVADFLQAKRYFRRKTAVLRFLATFAGGGLRDNVRCSSGLTGKRVGDFLLVLGLTELFSLRVTAEAIRAKIDRKLAISLQRGHFNLKCQVRRWGRSHQSFLNGYS